MTLTEGKVTTLDHLRPNDRAERRASLIAIHAQLSASGLAYHSIVINLNVMLITAMIFMTGYFLATVAGASASYRLLLAAFPMTLSSIGIVVTVIVRNHYFAIARMIRRIDEINGVFEPGHFLPDEPLYPEEWKAFGGSRWREIVFDIFVPVQTLIGFAAAALIIMR